MSTIDGFYEITSNLNEHSRLFKMPIYYKEPTTPPFQKSSQENETHLLSNRIRYDILQMLKCCNIITDFN